MMECLATDTEKRPRLERAASLVLGRAVLRLENQRLHVMARHVTCQLACGSLSLKYHVRVIMENGDIAANAASA